jgi:methionyl-tRNA formyltransferase
MSLSAVRTVFFGTPEFALPSLEAVARKTNLVGVVTQPDKPAGRKKILKSPAVKLWAQENVPTVPVFQPDSLRLSKDSGRAFFEQLVELKPDLIVLAVYGKILPREIIEFPKFGCINVHPSLLPRYRGASPLQSAILNGDTESGISIMKMDEGQDTGPVLLQRTYPLPADITISQLHDDYAVKGAALLIEALERYISGEIHPQEQPSEGIVECGLLTKEDGLITASDSPLTIDRKFRAYHPWPGIYTVINGKRIKILDLEYDTNTNSMSIKTVQLEGKTPRDYASFIKQYPELALI